MCRVLGPLRVSRWWEGLIVEEGRTLGLLDRVWGVDGAHGAHAEVPPSPARQPPVAVGSRILGLCLCR